MTRKENKEKNEFDFVNEPAIEYQILFPKGVLSSMADDKSMKMKRYCLIFNNCTSNQTKMMQKHYK